MFDLQNDNKYAFLYLLRGIISAYEHLRAIACLTILLRNIKISNAYHMLCSIGTTFEVSQARGPDRSGPSRFVGFIDGFVARRISARLVRAAPNA